MKFVSLVKKDMKNIFRSWSSIFLLFIGPLSILLLLIIAFSSAGFRDVKIGYVGDMADELINRVSYLGEFQSYNTEYDCTNALKRQQLHACLTFTKISDTNLHVKVTFDNAREVISVLMIDHLKQAILSEEDAQVLTQTQSLFDDVSEISLFLHDTKSSINDVIIDLDNQKDDLKSMRGRIQSTKADVDNSIDQAFRDVSAAENRQNNLAPKILNPLNDVHNDLSRLLFELYSIRATIDTLGVPQLSAEFNSHIRQVEDQQRIVDNMRNDVIYELNTNSNQLQQLRSNLYELQDSTSVIGDIDNEIYRASEGINNKVDMLKTMQNKLGGKADSANSITSKNTDSLINPFDIQLDPLYKGSKKADQASRLLTDEQKEKFLNFGSIQLLFPIIICMIMMFIAVIFSNIVTLDELHSPAYFRSLILPVSDFYSTLALLFSAFIISFTQILFVLIIGNFMFLLDILSNLFAVSFVTLLLVAIFSLCGMIIAYLVRTETTSLLVSTFFIIMNFILAGIITPVERMSSIMSAISAKLPFTLGLSMLQQSVFYGITIQEMLIPTWFMIMYIFVLTGILYLARAYARSLLKNV